MLPFMSDSFGTKTFRSLKFLMVALLVEVKIPKKPLLTLNTTFDLFSQENHVHSQITMFHTQLIDYHHYNFPKPVRLKLMKSLTIFGNHVLTNHQKHGESHLTIDAFWQKHLQMLLGARNLIKVSRIVLQQCIERRNTLQLAFYRLNEG